jgi:hypothetical protein
MKHLVVELPTGDWAEIVDGGKLVLHVFEDEQFGEVCNGASPSSVESVQSVEMDLDFDPEGEGGIEVGSGRDACELCGQSDGHHPRCPRGR